MATSLLHQAAAHGALDEVRLAAKASNVNEPDANGQTALHHAARGGNPDVVKYLLSIGARADVTDKVRCAHDNLSLYHGMYGHAEVA